MTPRHLEGLRDTQVEILVADGCIREEHAAEIAVAAGGGGVFGRPKITLPNDGPDESVSVPDSLVSHGPRTIAGTHEAEFLDCPAT